MCVLFTDKSGCKCHVFEGLSVDANARSALVASAVFSVNKVSVSRLRALSAVGTKKSRQFHLVRLLRLSEEEDQNKASPVKTY